jgi:hypothetical protein
MSSTAKSALGAAMVIAFPIIADVCGLELPKWARFAILQVFALWVITLLLAMAVSHLQKAGFTRSFSARASTVLVIIFGAAMGAIIAPIIWNSIRPDDIDIVQTILPTGDDPASPVEDEESATDELEFYFHPFLIGGGRGSPGGTTNIQYSGATITNRSSRKMHLQLWAHAYYWDDDGKPKSIGFQPEWNPDGLKARTGETTIDLDAYESKEGSLVLFFDQPKRDGVKRWNINAFERVYVHAFDSVTGKHIAFKATPGYPDGKAPWPLPSPAELLALDFPRADAAATQDWPALESFDLLARTQFFGYSNDDKLSISAEIENHSNDRMKLQINLLTRKSVDDKEWRTIRGVIKPLRKEDRGELDYYALDFGPGDIASCSLVFANTGFTNKRGEELKESPNLTLLEIFDEISRKKVWCAIEPGYPPGTDMRWAAIQAPPAIPKSDLDNTKNDGPKDSK